MANPGQLVYFALVLFVIVYGLVLAGINLDGFQERTPTERAVGFYCVFSVLLISGMVIYSLSTCISPTKANAMLLQMGINPLF